MYPGTIVNWHDQSAISNTTTETSNNTCLFLTAASFDKGPETMQTVTGSDFFTYYGDTMNFAVNGQPALQAANIAKAGGSLLVKRVVADDSTLANVAIIATLTNTKILTTATTGDTDTVKLSDFGLTDASDTEYVLTSSTSKVKWVTITEANLKTYDTIEAAVLTAYPAKPTPAVSQVATGVEGQTSVVTTASYPIAIIVDNGRGISSKSVKLDPIYNNTITNTAFLYTLSVYEGTSVSEKCTGTIDPDCVISSKSYSFSEDSSVQVYFHTINAGFANYEAAVCGFTGISSSDIGLYDIIFATTSKGTAMGTLSLTTDSADLNSAYGIDLESGTNGSFGDLPLTTDAYKEALVDFFDGTYDNAIYDLDTYHIGACFDANYPDAVKESIAALANFREDFVFFRDYGTTITTYAEISEKAQSSSKTNSRYIADYCTSYQIYDPETYKRIRVSMMYDMAYDAVAHFSGGAYRPLAGIVNGFTLANAIDGTINFIPRITPDVNQKTELDDLRVNYAIFQNNQCIVQSLYTSQSDYTQLSYINNVLAIQEVVRSIRTNCPKTRYTFTSNSDFTYYSTAVNNVISNFTDNFSSLKFDYTQDDTAAMQKIFYGSIYFKFNNWEQTEVFDVYALGNDD